MSATPAQRLTKIYGEAEEEFAKRAISAQQMVDRLDEIWLQLLGERHLLSEAERREAIGVINRVMQVLIKECVLNYLPVAVANFVTTRVHLKCTGKAFLAWAGSRTGTELVAETSRVRDELVERQTHRDAIELALELTALSYELRTSPAWMLAPTYPLPSSYTPCAGPQQVAFVETIRKKLVQRQLSASASSNARALILEALVSWRDEALLALLAKTYQLHLRRTTEFAVRLKSYFDAAVVRANYDDPFKVPPEQRRPVIVSALLYYVILEDALVIAPVAALL